MQRFTIEVGTKKEGEPPSVHWIGEKEYETRVGAVAAAVEVAKLQHFDWYRVTLVVEEGMLMHDATWAEIPPYLG